MIRLPALRLGLQAGLKTGGRARHWDQVGRLQALPSPLELEDGQCRDDENDDDDDGAGEGDDEYLPVGEERLSHRHVISHSDLLSDLLSELLSNLTDLHSLIN